jgi:hypothetical protein
MGTIAKFLLVYAFAGDMEAHALFTFDRIENCYESRDLLLKINQAQEIDVQVYCVDLSEVVDFSKVEDER